MVYSLYRTTLIKAQAAFLASIIWASSKSIPRGENTQSYCRLLIGQIYPQDLWTFPAKMYRGIDPDGDDREVALFDVDVTAALLACSSDGPQDILWVTTRFQHYRGRGSRRAENLRQVTVGSQTSGIKSGRVLYWDTVWVPLFILPIETEK